MAGAIRVSPGSVPAALGDLPLPTRLAFRFAAQLRRGTLEALLPDGRRYVFGGAEDGPAATIKINDLRCLARFIKSGEIGLAEAYLRGEWETPDLTTFFCLFNVNHDLISSTFTSNPVMRVVQKVRHWLNRNTKRQAKRNIHAHYDLGNRFYASWLDETMTYSSALYEPGIDDLTTAQQRKYQRLAERIELKPGHNVLEIGCGWGGFAEYAAKTYGVNVVGLTISREQWSYAKARIFAAGLADKVEIKLEDYRDERGIYDRIASIEMIEAVGEAFWPDYFGQLRDRPVSGGMVGIQAITIQDRFFQTYRREVDFIRRYVFPGGMLPAPSILKALGQRFGLSLIGERVFGEDYVRTLDHWRRRFRAAWPTLAPLGFDERFRRVWEYYLAYCEAGFLSGKTDVRQMVFVKR